MRYQLRERLLGYAAILAAVILSGLLVAALLSGVLERTVTQPILAVADAAEQVIEQRDFSLRVARTSNDEVGRLVDAFNAMLAEVGGRTADLEESNRSLQREMHERKTAEAALRAADRRKDEFLATLAHELRNPLAPIANAVEILRNRQVAPQVADQAREMMERQVRQLVRLVDDLLDVSRITTGRLVLKRRPVAIRSIIDSAIETSRPLLRARGHVLGLEVAEQAIYVDADATRLGQVFSNLLNNAAKYTPPGGHIALAAHLAHGEVIVEVRDDGIGIAPEMLASIFDMFVQADTSLERTQSGLGVGLTLARRLVELHGGRLEAHSEGLNRGSRFSVHLPTIEAARRASAGCGSPEPSAIATRRILLVDDNRDFALSMEALLSAHGHAVRTAYSGAEALAAAAEFKPDVAFLDIGLPGMSGYELASALRASAATARTFLVAVTGWGQESDRARARAAGFDRHLVKPAEFDVILDVLRSLGAAA